MSNEKSTRLLVSPAVAQLVKEGSHDEQLAAIHGRSVFSLKDRLSLALYCFSRSNPAMQTEILSALEAVTADDLVVLLADPELHARHLELVARARLNDIEVMRGLLQHPAVSGELLNNIARHCRSEIFVLLAENQKLLDKYPQVGEGLLNNHRVDQAIKRQVDLLDEEPPAEEDPCDDDVDPSEPSEYDDCDDDPAKLSKYQTSLDLPVAEKIKLALTGDKEWRNIFIKDGNKLVSAAVLKNPRITDGEVLAVAKNKSSSDELIRLITMNNEWLKNYEIKRALVMHNRTPLPKALRFMTILSEKDIKALAKSRDVSSIIVNNARRMLVAKEKKK